MSVPANSVFAACGTTIFETMSRLAAQHGAINLGQGAPEAMEPEDVIAEAVRATQAGPHQYTPLMGVPALRQAVADHNRRFYGLDVDWEREVLVTAGATEALAACLFGLIEPGDEVVLIEPLYDSYLPIIRRAGGVPKLVRVSPPHWDLPRQDLAAAFGPRTRLMILNSPMNPSAKVFTPDELAFIGGLLEKHDSYAICDEVYEHLVFDGQRHVPLMTLPGLRDRCLRIGSAGKTFSVTGWRIGYVTACAALMAPVVRAHQFITFTMPHSLQQAIAYGLNKDDRYFTGLAADMQARRDHLSGGLKAIGFEVMPCPGTYFLVADFKPLGFDGDDDAFCRHITEKAGVGAVPVGAFYHDDGIGHFVRFCFAKKISTLDEALARLQRVF